MRGRRRRVSGRRGAAGDRRRKAQPDPCGPRRHAPARHHQLLRCPVGAGKRQGLHHSAKVRRTDRPGLAGDQAGPGRRGRRPGENHRRGQGPGQHLRPGRRACRAGREHAPRQTVHGRHHQCPGGHRRPVDPVPAQQRHRQGTAVDAGQEPGRAVLPAASAQSAGAASGQGRSRSAPARHRRARGARCTGQRRLCAQRTARYGLPPGHRARRVGRSCRLPTLQGAGCHRDHVVPVGAAGTVHGRRHQRSPRRRAFRAHGTLGQHRPCRRPCGVWQRLAGRSPR
ncbi:hypothetical protein D3C72_1105540 [compost metagenome]